MTQKRVFVVGSDKTNLEHLRQLPRAHECDFFSALELDDIRGVDTFDVPELSRTVLDNIEAQGGRPDAVVAFYDFPASTLVPIITNHYGLAGPSLEAVLKCEHKYWSRLEQHAVIPDHIPGFVAFDPCKVLQDGDLPLRPPCWIKPIKSFRSHLGFMINDDHQFLEAARALCENSNYMVRPLQHLLRHWQMPAEIAFMPETCIAEQVIGGAQCTVEGYVHNGEVVVYATVDSVREDNRSSFSRYQYPSSLPAQVQHRMIQIARRVIERIGLDHSCFNIEFFWDQTLDHIWLLEINPRLSQSHAELFELIHGVSHHNYMLDIALGKTPTALPEHGSCSIAANFHVRVHEPGRVERAPTPDEVRALENELGGVRIKINVASGQHLEDLPDQDSYSYEVANVFLGGNSEAELVERYHKVLDNLNFEIGRSSRSLDLHAG